MLPSEFSTVSAYDRAEERACDFMRELITDPRQGAVLSARLANSLRGDAEQAYYTCAIFLFVGQELLRLTGNACNGAISAETVAGQLSAVEAYDVLQAEDEVEFIIATLACSAASNCLETEPWLIGDLDEPHCLVRALTVLLLLRTHILADALAVPAPEALTQAIRELLATRPLVGE